VDETETDAGELVPASASTDRPLKPLRLEFCGEWYDIDPARGFTVGRDADLVIDDNPYLHRRFIVIRPDRGLWWIENAGNLLSATVTDASGHVQAWLSPGAKLPIVFEALHVLFTAGSTTYDFTVHNDDDVYSSASTSGNAIGATTIEPIPLTRSQRQLIVALAENVLTQSVPGRGEIPSSAVAAARLGWTITAFNRKLDNVCEKLDKVGVQGLRGGRGKLATSRRARLVEYAVSTRLVSRDDLPLLDAQVESN
jgi:hypothetical protein